MTLRVLVLAAALLMASRASFANGRFPNASLFLIAPGDPTHWVVRTTFGLLESRDRGNSFSWICEQALELDDQEDPMLALTANGSLLAATYDGIVFSRDGCGFQFASGIEREIVGDLTRDPDSPERLLAFTVRGLAQGGFFSQLFVSEDDGVSFTPRGQPLDPELLPLSIEIAKSGGARVYLTARSGTRDDYRSVLLWSDDGGVHFEEQALPVPDTNDRSLAFIAAVHPQDRDRLFVRTSDPAGNRLLLSQDGGVSFSSLFTAIDGLYAFALSPDGGEMLFGGPEEGVWAASASDGSGLEFRSNTPVSCLTYDADELYACVANDLSSAISRSLDGGRSFSPALSLSKLCGPTACERATDVGRICPAYWTSVAQTLNAPCGNLGAGGASAAGNGGDGGARADEARPSGGCTMTQLPRGGSLIPIALLVVAGWTRRLTARTLVEGRQLPMRQRPRVSCGSDVV